MLSEHIDPSKACLLIALNDLFEDVDIEWGQDFLEDYFMEYGEYGFHIDHLYLIDECAPVIRFQHGQFTAMWQQGDSYFTFVHDDTQTRYRLYKNTKVVLCFKYSDTLAHALCLPAHAIMDYLRKYEFLALIIPKYNTIIDKGIS